MQIQIRSNLWSGRFDAQRAGRVFDAQQITRGTSEIHGFTLSPDGNRVAFSRLGQGGFDIYTAPVSGGESHQITFDGAFFGEPVWSPDGKSIACAAFKDGMPRVYVVGSEGGTPRAYAKTVTTLDGAIAWAPGPCILYGTPGNRNFRVLDPATESEHLLVPNDSVGWMFDPHASRDGSEVAVRWSRKSWGIWVVSLRDGGERLVTSVFSNLVSWSADGQNLYAFRKEGTPTILDIALATGKTRPFLTLPSDQISAVDMDPVTRRLVWAVDESQMDAWLFENFDPDVE
jgi:Tol biopolymer transport system component